MVKYISSIPRSEITGIVVENETMVSGSYENLWVTYNKAEGAKWGGLSLTKLMIDATQSKKNKSKPIYKINETPVTKSSALYLIRYRDANKGLFKIGRGSKLVRRLAKYKTSLPKDNEILLVSTLVIPNPEIIVAIEKVLIANLRYFSELYPSKKCKQLRKTEHFTRGIDNFGEALVLRCFFCLATHIAKTHPKLNVHMHLYGMAAFNKMLTLPNIGYTPRFDIVPKKWKGLSPLEEALAEAEAQLVEDEDDRGFTKRQLSSILDPVTQKVTVFIEPITFS